MIVNGYEIKEGANLRDADLRNANLWGADLRGADLRGANLWGADLMNTVGDGAVIRTMQPGGMWLLYAMIGHR